MEIKKSSNKYPTEVLNFSQTQIFQKKWERDFINKVKKYTPEIFELIENEKNKSNPQELNKNLAENYLHKLFSNLYLIYTYNPLFQSKILDFILYSIIVDDKKNLKDLFKFLLKDDFNDLFSNGQKEQIIHILSLFVQRRDEKMDLAIKSQKTNLTRISELLKVSIEPEVFENFLNNLDKNSPYFFKVFINLYKKNWLSYDERFWLKIMMDLPPLGNFKVYNSKTEIKLNSQSEKHKINSESLKILFQNMVSGLDRFSKLNIKPKIRFQVSNQNSKIKYHFEDVCLFQTLPNNQIRQIDLEYLKELDLYLYKLVDFFNKNIVQIFPLIENSTRGKNSYFQNFDINDFKNFDFNKKDIFQMIVFNHSDIE